jgi:thiamine-monophosphate kinase
MKEEAKARLRDGGRKRLDVSLAGKSSGAGMSELGLLDEIRGRIAKSPSRGVALGIGDDCALLSVRSGEELAVTTDLSIAGRHFRLDWHPAESIGHRALARGLSDLAAMGARPVAAFLSLGLPRALTRGRGRGPSWISRFYEGLLALADAHGVPQAGGDLAESQVALADIVLVGAVPRGKALLRSGALPGDLLYVTGRLGGAAAGLARLIELAAASGLRGRTGALKVPKGLEGLLAAHLYPQPRIAQGLWLRRRGLASAAIDLSDGLSTDLAHLCAESDVAAEVEAALLPIGAGANLEQALHGGEDYELLFTAAAAAQLPKSIGGVAVRRIGKIVRSGKGRPPVTLVTAQGKRALEPSGWEHFS